MAQGGYDGDGLLTGIAVSGVQSLAFGYDAADRLTRITNGRDATLIQAFATTASRTSRH